MATKKKSNRAMRFHVGRCCECGDSILLTDLWCGKHRKTGPMPYVERTYEESEANHGDRIRDLIRAGKI